MVLIVFYYLQKVVEVEVVEVCYSKIERMKEEEEEEVVVAVVEVVAYRHHCCSP